MTVHQLTALLRRQEALARSDFKEGPAGPASADEWATGLTAVTTAGLQLGEGWSVLLDFVSKSGIRQLIVPVDDADQSPDLLPALLRDLRWLTGHALVSAIACADDSSLVAVLAAAQSERLAEPLRARQAGAMALKVLPRHLRLELPRLSANERLAFTPLGQQRSILELLERFGITGGRRHRLRTLADLFVLDIAGETTPSPYAPMIPELPRQVEQLWFALEDLSKSKPATRAQASMEAIRLLVTRAIERTDEEHSNIPKTVDFDTEDGTLAVVLDVSKIDFGMRMGRGMNLFLSGSSTVGVRRVEGFGAVVRTREDEDEEAKDSNSRLLLPPAFVHAHRFLLELGDPDALVNPPLLLRGIYGTLMSPGGRNWTGTIECRVAGEQSDNRFLLVPEWHSFYDIALYTAAWNRVVDMLMLRRARGESMSMGGPDGAQWIEWIVCLHIGLVCDIQSDRVISTPLLPRRPSDLVSAMERWDAAATLAGLQERLIQLYQRKETPEGRGEVFRNWMDTSLPRCADRAICREPFAEALLAVRAAVLQEAGTYEAANARVVTRLRQDVTSYLSSDWIASRIDLIERFNERAASELRDARTVMRERVGQHQRLFVQALEQRGAPSELIGRVLLTGIDADVTEDLMRLGIPPDTVEVLAKNFPPVGEEAREQLPAAESSALS